MRLLLRLVVSKEMEDFSVPLSAPLGSVEVEDAPIGAMDVVLPPRILGSSDDGFC